MLVDVEVDVELEVEVVVQAAVALHLVPSYRHNLEVLVSKYISPATALLGSEESVLIRPAKFKCVVILIVYLYFR